MVVQKKEGVGKFKASSRNSRSVANDWIKFDGRAAGPTSSPRAARLQLVFAHHVVDGRCPLTPLSLLQLPSFLILPAAVHTRA